MLLWKH